MIKMYEKVTLIITRKTTTTTHYRNDHALSFAVSNTTFWFVTQLN